MALKPSTGTLAVVETECDDVNIGLDIYPTLSKSAGYSRCLIILTA